MTAFSGRFLPRKPQLSLHSKPFVVFEFTPMSVGVAHKNPCGLCLRAWSKLLCDFHQQLRGVPKTKMERAGRPPPPAARVRRGSSSLLSPRATPESRPTAATPRTCLQPPVCLGVTVAVCAVRQRYFQPKLWDVAKHFWRLASQ